MTSQTAPPRRPFHVDRGVSLHAWLRHMRDHEPVYFDTTMNSWRVLRHADAVQVFSDWQVFSNDMHRVMPAQEFKDGNLSALDPPEHRSLRGLLSQGFTPRMLAPFAGRIESLVVEILEELEEQGEFDLAAGLAYQLPLNVISELLGVDRDGREVLRRCSDAQLTLSTDDPTDDAFIQNREKAMREILDYLRDHARERRTRPRDDMISRLVHAEMDGRRLTETEIVNFSVLLLLAGHLTTMGLLGSMVACLDEHPETLAEIRADRSLLGNTVEEVLRYLPPVPDAGRVTNQEVTLGGATIPADQFVLISLTSANWDERAYPDPSRFDIHRTPNPQLAFTHGIHVCLGAHLARLEGKVALDVLLNRYRTWEVTGVDWYENNTICAPRRLTVAVQRHT
ncbi:cytochrome P450 [Streptomyces broussonetiae]|uniref:Cytochrome P450 n=1 Tax=Streptomyces broussonetiae TaxID=2686304 RepID=A0ABV5ECT0_9ACTN